MGEIDKIVQKIYEIFSGNRPGEYIDACTFCCISEENARKIKSLPIREIPLDLLKEYQDAAKPEQLNLSELKYFAPRYFDLIKDFQFPTFEPLLSLNRFGYFNDSDWATEEKELLDKFVLAFFKKYIYSKPQDVSISPIDMLLMFYKGNFKIDVLLKEWEVSNAENSLIHFSKLLDNLKITKRGVLKVNDAFADDVFNEQICNWIENKHVKDIFRKKIENEIMNPNGLYNEDELQALSWKYEMIN